MKSGRTICFAAGGDGRAAGLTPVQYASAVIFKRDSRQRSHHTAWTFAYGTDASGGVPPGRQAPFCGRRIMRILSGRQKI